MELVFGEIRQVMDIIAMDNTTLRAHVAELSQNMELQTRRHIEERTVAKQALAQLWQYAYATHDNFVPFNSSWTIYQMANNLPITSFIHDCTATS